jgi:hypothetical protein
MTLIDRLPSLTDAEVNNLLANARRLSDGANEARRSAAAELLPALESEALARDAARAEALVNARKARSNARRVAAKAA